MTYNTETPVKFWDMEVYDPDQRLDFWRTINALPEGSVIATGFIDDGLIYFEKTADDWTIVQVDNPNTEDIFTVGATTEGDSAVIDAGGDTELAYVIREGS